MSVTLQRFKVNDEFEAKVIAAALPALQALGLALDDFYSGAYVSEGLGAVLYDLDRDPIVDSVPREIYLQSYPQIHQLFTRPATFEFYLDVFRAVWGDDVEVEFTIPGPGQLSIAIAALGQEFDNFLARRIEDNAYVYDDVVLHDGGHLQFQTSKGLRTQAETDSLIFELQMAGVYTIATLDIS